MLVLIILAVVWAAVLVPPFLRNRRDARPDNSVVSFRAQLSTLERATPGTSLRSVSSPPPAAVATLPAPVSRPDVRRRRRAVLVALLGATGSTFVLLFAVGGALVTVLFVASTVVLAAYVFALRQLKMRSIERVAKVRPLVPRSAPAPVLALRRTVSN